MGLVVNDVIETEVINFVLGGPLTIRIFGNNVVPTGTHTAAAYTEIAGAGYANKPLIIADWVITPGNPSIAKYPTQTWIFTGPVNAPGTIFGYFVTRNSNGGLVYAERFPDANVPFISEAGSKIVVVPKFSVQSQF